MSGCCQGDTCAASVIASQRTTLIWVLIINAVMFVVEMSSGLLAHSSSLLADSLDMLGDTLVYGFSLLVIARGKKLQAVSALLKGCIMLAFGLFVVAEVIYKIMTPLIPVAETMGGIGLLALLANLFCLYLLWKHRSDNINMRSVWLCSRNDVIANSGVLLAAAAVALVQHRWPDILIGAIIAALFLRSSLQVLKEAYQQYRDHSSNQ